jgi:predicted metal-dependent hydrolase
MADINELKVRQINFQFDPQTPFYWNPDHVHWGNFVNFVTLIAPGFERYFIRAIRDAMPRISNPAIAEEADKFCRQEAQHSRQHIAHLKVLLNQYPKLEQVFAAVNQSYEHLYQSQSLEFHLGYAAVIELCFGPLAKFIIENRDQLFSGADPTISSFMLWHLVEEFEHRNAAYNVFNDVVQSYQFRLKTVIPVARHILEIRKLVRDGLNTLVPASPSGIAPGEVEKFMVGTPISSRCRLVYELCCTLLPLHRPNSIGEPDWVRQWFRDEEAGVDMTRYYSAPSTQ